MADSRINRKLAAILSADAVGYSKLMADDEAATVTTLKQYRSTIAEVLDRFKGRIVNAPGDNILAEFSSAVDAVQGAVEIQKLIEQMNARLTDDRRMQFRIGVNLGDVIEEDDGTIYGDGVNIAARIESLAQPGTVCVSSSIFEAVEGKLDYSFDYLGQQSVKNIDKPVRVYTVSTSLAEQPTSRSSGQKRRLRLAVATIVLVLLSISLSLLQFGRAPTSDQSQGINGGDPILSLPTGPTIAVLPFDNMSGDPEQEYFSDGLTEDIITRLSRFERFFVIARNSTYQYKGQPVDVREVGRDLGARYVVEGSVRRSGDSIRVTAQLLDSENGTHLWAETYDRDLSTASIFDIQDDITARIAATIADERGILVEAVVADVREKQTDDLDAYECSLRLEIYEGFGRPDQHFKLRECAERTVESNPDYSLAWTALAWAYLDEFRYGLNLRPDPLERSLNAALRAVELDADDELARRVLANVYFAQQNLDRFRTEGERAIALNPNNASVLADIGSSLVNIGEIERGAAMVRKAAALNPHHPGWYYFALTFAEYQNMNYDAALNYALRINMPDFFWNHVMLAAAYGQLGRKDEASEAITNLLALYPEFAENAWYEHQKWNAPDNVIRHSLDGLRKAGLNVPGDPE